MGAHQNLLFNFNRVFEAFSFWTLVHAKVADAEGPRDRTGGPRKVRVFYERKDPAPTYTILENIGK